MTNEDLKAEITKKKNEIKDMPKLKGWFDVLRVDEARAELKVLKRWLASQEEMEKEIDDLKDDLVEAGKNIGRRITKNEELMKEIRTLEAELKLNKTTLKQGAEIVAESLRLKTENKSLQKEIAGLNSIVDSSNCHSYWKGEAKKLKQALSKLQEEVKK